MHQVTDQTVVLHVSDGPADVQRGLNSAARIVSAFPGAHLHIIVNGAAVPGAAGQLAVDLPQNTTLSACEAAMSQRGLKASQLRPGVQTVPSAVVSIVEAQLKGAAYVRI